MRKIKNLALTLLTAIMCITSSLTSFAMYDDGSYDVVPDDDIIIVDNKIHPNATCQVLFHILYPTDKIKEGQFQYLFNYFENGEQNVLSFQNRLENGNDIGKNVGTGRIITYKIQLEPGEYSFTNSAVQDIFNVLTPDLELPEKIFSPDGSGTVYYKVNVNGPMELFAIYGEDDFVEENKDAFIEYAKSVQTLGVDSSSDDILNDINVDDYNSLDELLNALREAGCTEEQIEMARAAFEDSFAKSESVAETEDTVTTETPAEEEQVVEEETSQGTPVMAYVIGAIIGLVIIVGITLFKKR